MGNILSSPISDLFFYRFWSPKRCPKGGILGAQMEPKSIPKRGRNLRAKTLPLKSDLGRFCVVLGGVPDAFVLTFYLFSYYFQENDVFEEDRCPRPIRERKMTKHDPKMPPKTTPKRLQNDIFFSCFFGAHFDAILGRPSTAGLPRITAHYRALPRITAARPGRPRGVRAVFPL